MSARINVTYTLLVDEDDMPAVHASLEESSRRTVFDRVRDAAEAAGRQVVVNLVEQGNAVLLAKEGIR